MTISDLFVSLVPDLIVGAILIIFGFIGAKRGMFRTFSGLLTILIAVFGAMFVADHASELVSDYIAPLFEPMVEKKLADILAESALSGETGSLGILGLIPGVEKLVEGAAGALAENLAPAVAREVAHALAWVVFFVVGFVVFKLLCKLVLLLLDAIDQIPGLHFLNHLIGALLGLLQGFLLLLLAVWLLTRFGVLPEDLVEETVLLRWLTGLAPVY